MQEDELLEQCEQLALIRAEIRELKKLEKELAENIKEAVGGSGIIRDSDGRVCQVASRRNRKLGTRVKFFKSYLRRTFGA